MDRAKSIANGTAAYVEASNSAACEVVDLTNTKSSKTTVTKTTAGTGERIASNPNVVDLTDIDNPCYNPAEMESGPDRQRLLNPRGTPRDQTPDTLTWESVYAKLPYSVQQQFDKPELESPTHRQEPRNTPANLSNTGIPDEDKDEYADDFLDKETNLLIELTDRVSSEVASTATAGPSSTTPESEPCPVCEQGKKVRTIFSDMGGHPSGYRCSDQSCWFEELDY